uniref:Uncharacterized protein n=1 Tax=Periophthalmus magnuspinnatus TaxID=409849 RepID=A0A3B4AS83_9GOBI
YILYIHTTIYFLQELGLTASLPNVRPRMMEITRFIQFEVWSDELLEAFRTGLCCKGCFFIRFEVMRCCGGSRRHVQQK